MASLDPRRKCLFTASEIHKLISNGSTYEPCEFSEDYTCYTKDKNKETGTFEYNPVCEPPKKGKNVYRYNADFMTEDAFNYCIAKANPDLYFDREKPSFGNFSTQYGTDHEHLAVEWLRTKKSIDLIHTGENQQFFIHSSGMFGATPDGLKLNDDFVSYELGVEIKTPDQNTHTWNCLVILTYVLLKKHYPDYYWQCLAGMEATGADKWLWVSFAPDKITDTERGHVIEINRADVQHDIDFMLRCITKAHNFKLQIIEKLS